MLDILHFRYNSNNKKDELNTNVRSIASLEERMEKELKEEISRARNGNDQHLLGVTNSGWMKI